MSDGNGTPNLNEPDPKTPADPAPSDPTNPNPSDPPAADPSLVTGEPKDPAEPAEPEPFVPLTAEDLDFGEGVEVNEELRDKFLGVMNNQELSLKERSQALTALQVDAAKAMAEASNRAFTDQQKAWQDEVKADPEIGGAKLEATLGGISRLVDRYGDEELVQVMAATGAGNSKAVIKFLSKIAVDLNEGKPATGSAATEKPDVASRLFPSMKG